MECEAVEATIWSQLSAICYSSRAQLAMAGLRGRLRRTVTYVRRGAL